MMWWYVTWYDAFLCFNSLQCGYRCQLHWKNSTSKSTSLCCDVILLLIFQGSRRQLTPGSAPCTGSPVAAFLYPTFARPCSRDPVCVYAPCVCVCVCLCVHYASCLLAFLPAEAIRRAPWVLPASPQSGATDVRMAGPRGRLLKVSPLRTGFWSSISWLMNCRGGWGGGAGTYGCGFDSEVR